MKPILVRLTATGPRGTCCPNAFGVRRIRLMSICNPTSYAREAAEVSEDWSVWAVTPGGMAEWLESAAEVAEIESVDGCKVDVESLAARLRAGTVWS